jgi:hypothetical protein
VWRLGQPALLQTPVQCACSRKWGKIGKLPSAAALGCCCGACRLETQVHSTEVLGPVCAYRKHTLLGSGPCEAGGWRNGAKTQVESRRPHTATHPLGSCEPEGNVSSALNSSHPPLKPIQPQHAMHNGSPQTVLRATVAASCSGTAQLAQTLCRTE